VNVLDRFRLDGRVAVVTGAGRGIGAATAVALAQAGADVVIAARSPDQLRATATAIEAAGRTAHVVVADLSDTAEAARLSDAAREAFGRLDVVVNNVGGAVPRPFLDTTAEALEEAFRFNVSTAHALIKSAIPLMLDNGGGSVINISSVLALISGRGFLSYGTAKGSACPLHRARRAGPGPAYPGQRHRRRHHRHGGHRGDYRGCRAPGAGRGGHAASSAGHRG
jgi:7-alpha-hydroxysteroid dehydrogenase